MLKTTINAIRANILSIARFIFPAPKTSINATNGKISAKTLTVLHKPLEIPLVDGVAAVVRKVEAPDTPQLSLVSFTYTNP